MLNANFVTSLVTYTAAQRATFIRALNIYARLLFRKSDVGGQKQGGDHMTNLMLSVTVKEFFFLNWSAFDKTVHYRLKHTGQ